MLLQFRSRLALFVVAALTGCVSQPNISQIGKDKNSLASYARHGKIEILRDMRIPANRYRVYLQNGTTVEAVDIIEPHCDLEMKQAPTHETTIKKDRFPIIGVTVDEEKISGGFSRATSAAMGTMTLFTTQLFLLPANGSNVMRMSCTKMDESAANGHVSMEEFKRAVGSFVGISVH